jgi:iron complex outermembrane recepter protein
MKTIPAPFVRAFRRAAPAAGAALLMALQAPPLPAQTPPPPGPAPAGDLIVLTPFEVDASKDTRYSAASTLAGSRLNTELKNISATIDVYTKDFMEDIGATDLESVLRYANSYEQGDDTTQGNQSGTGTGNVTTAPLSFRVRGLPAARARNYFTYDFPVDTYNLERLDESRGPNAILFGFGSPGGIVNASTKQAQTGKSAYELMASAGNLIHNRVTLDANQVLLRGRAALRVNALHQEKSGWRTYTFDDKDAVSLALRLQPTRKTRIDVEYESLVNHDAASRPGTFWTQTTTWEAAGRPLINGSFANRTSAALNPGLNASVLAQVSGNVYWVYNEQSGTLANWRGMTRANILNYTAPDGTVYTNSGDFRVMQTAPEGILGVNVQGPSMDRKLDLGQFFVTVRQELAKHLDLELAATRVRSNWWAYRIGAATLNADPNSQLPAGGVASTGPAATNPAANPFAGKSYIEGQDQYWITQQHAQNYRAALSYDFDAGKWLGRHRLGALLEQDRATIRQQNLAEQLFVNGRLSSPLANNAQNQLIRRHYVLEPANSRDYHYANTRVPGVPLDVTLADGTRLTSGYTQYTNNPQDYAKDDRSMMVVAQSAWWGDRVHTIAGIRRDRITFDDAGTYVDNGNGGYSPDARARSMNTVNGTTRNYGLVFQPAAWLSLVANASSSLGQPNYKTTYVPDGHFSEPNAGKGRDYGVRVTLPNRRLAFALTYFEAWSKNEPGGTNVNVWGVSGPNSLLDALITNGFLTPAAAAPLRTFGGSDTLDQQSRGWEGSISGELAPGWNARINYSHTERTTTNALRRIEGWAVSTLRPFWATLNRPNPNDPQRGNLLDTVFSGASSLRTIIDNFESNLVNRRLGDEAVASVRPHKINLFTSYDLRQGPARGLRLGGGWRYESPVVIGQDADNRDIRGFSHTSVDLMAAYSRELWRRRWTLQVNVNNAFRDRPTYSPAVLNTAGIGANTIVVFPPQEIVFSLRTKF